MIIETRKDCNKYISIWSVKEESEQRAAVLKYWRSQLMEINNVEYMIEELKEKVKNCELPSVIFKDNFGTVLTGRVIKAFMVNCIIEYKSAFCGLTSINVRMETLKMVRS